MPCYVDAARLPLGRMLMCHLWADSDNELFAMVDAIGVARRHLQTENWRHFDISKEKREHAVRLGAIVTDFYGPIRHCTALDLASSDPEIRARGERRAASLAKVMAGRNIDLFGPLKGWERR